jgi:hypothetical protein
MLRSTMFLILCSSLIMAGNVKDRRRMAGNRDAAITLSFSKEYDVSYISILELAKEGPLVRLCGHSQEQMK